MIWMNTRNGWMYVLVLCTAVTIGSFAPCEAGNSSDSEATFIPKDSYAGRVSEASRRSYNQGTLLLQAGRYHQAIEMLRRSVEASRHNVDAWDHLGICYRRTGQYQKAIDAYTNSLAINPDNPVPYTNLGLIYSQHIKDFPKALNYYFKVVEMDPTDPEGPYGLGGTYEEMGDYDKAIGSYLTAADLYKRRNSAFLSHAYFRLGICYANKRPSEYAVAAAYFQRAEQAGFDLPSGARQLISRYGR